MNQPEAEKMTNYLIRLFPKRGDKSLGITPEEISLFRKLFRPYPVELVEAAIEGYKSETKRTRPILGELRSKLLAMNENHRAGVSGKRVHSPVELFRAKMGRDESTSDYDVLFDAHNEMILHAAELYGHGSPNVSRLIREAGQDFEASGLSEYFPTAERSWRGEP